MVVKRQLSFGPFRLDEANECIWHGAKAIQLRPKAYAVLKYLIERPGVLVTKQQLLDDVWPDTFVSDAVLKDGIRQLREALGDDAKAPRFIQTAHRRGYRFIAALSEAKESSIDPPKPDFPAQPQFCPLPQASDVSLPPTSIFGREEALAEMKHWLDQSLDGNCQIGFVTGETGIGKTTLVEAFLEQAKTVQNILIARGECLEQFGAGEAYLPVLDSFSRLGQEHGLKIVEVLRRHAPTWLIQMPALASVDERQSLQTQVPGVTRERMLREMAEAIEALTSEEPLILVLEDLHWCDYSTLDLITYLARRRQSFRLLLIGTYRPVEVIVSEHPLKGAKEELQLHKLCNDLPLEYLSEEAVAQYLSLKFPGHGFCNTLAGLIHRRTEGNPLFMVNMVDYLIGEGIVSQIDGNWKLQADLEEVELEVPENIRHMIEKHIDRLTAEEQRILEGASVVGMDCSAVAISAGLAEDVVRIEEVCDGLARRHHFLLPAYLAELPDGTITPRYRFIHALYLDVLYKRVAPTRRSKIHGRIGERGEAIYGDRVSEIAAELAVHFEESRDFVRVVKYLQMAAENAVRRSADYEAVTLARRGLQLLELLPDTAERAEQQKNLRNFTDRSRQRSSIH
jgi:predicted ATPase/DNA-binding winged helix-turn-helix (wHTH) protein